MMKNTYKIILLTLILILCFTLTSFAQDEIKVYVDNERVDFDVEPIIENGRTLIPLRGVLKSWEPG